MVTGLRIVGLLRGPLQQVTDNGGQITAEPVTFGATNPCHLAGEPATSAALARPIIPPNLLVSTNVRQTFYVIIGRWPRPRNNRRVVLLAVAVRGILAWIHFLLGV